MRKFAFATVLIGIGLAIGSLLSTYLLSILWEGRIQAARDQIEVFYSVAEGTRDKPEDRAAYIKAYYPSGTKHASGSELDRIVEAVRSKVLQGLGE